jgi:hypothetical protein
VPGDVESLPCARGAAADADLVGKWGEVSRIYRRMMGLALGRKPGHVEFSKSGKGLGQTICNTDSVLESRNDETVLKDPGITKMLFYQIRHFPKGTVIGSKEFVNDAFAGARKRFGPRRKDGARKLRGRSAAPGGTLWSLRDLRKGIA